MNVPPPRVTLSAVASAAGVSLPTVSKVLNGRADVAPETRALVERAIASTGYKRRRGLGPTTAAMVDLVFHGLQSPWANIIQIGVQTEARRHGADVVVGEFGGSLTPTQEWLTSVLNRRPAGVVMVFCAPTPEQRVQLDARRIPYVLVDPVVEETSVHSVGSLNFHGGRLATNHLIRLGHRRIGAISGPTATLTARIRTAGYIDALERAGIASDDSLIREGRFDVDSGYDATMSLMTADEPPTAIFAGSDLQAVGTYQAAHTLGLRIPEDLSVVGYDDMYLTEWLIPKLTTVRQPLMEMGAMATQMIFALATGRDLPAKKIDLDAELVVRDSTAHPPETA